MLLFANGPIFDLSAEQEFVEDQSRKKYGWEKQKSAEANASAEMKMTAFTLLRSKGSWDIRQLLFRRA